MDEREFLENFDPISETVGGEPNVNPWAPTLTEFHELDKARLSLLRDNISLREKITELEGEVSRLRDNQALLGKGSD